MLCTVMYDVLVFTCYYVSVVLAVTLSYVCLCMSRADAPTAESAKEDQQRPRKRQTWTRKTREAISEATFVFPCVHVIIT